MSPATARWSSASGGATVLNDNMTRLQRTCVSVPLACMGLERTLRHHCDLPQEAKQMTCSGDPGDNGSSSGARGYCEGEIHTGGGQDFLTGATSVSVLELHQAMSAWALVCKQPDVPCDVQQCATWCHRTIQPDNNATGNCIANPARLAAAGSGRWRWRRLLRHPSAAATTATTAAARDSRAARVSAAAAATSVTRPPAPAFQLRPRRRIARPPRRAAVTTTVAWTEASRWVRRAPPWATRIS